MVQGDLLPVLELDVVPEDPADLAAITTATPVVLIMRAYGATTPLIAAGPATVTSVAGGTVRVVYQWQGADTATPGDYQADVRFTISGRLLTVPTKAPATIRIRPKLG